MATRPKVRQEEAPCEPIRVMIIDGHARVRQGLRFFLSTCANIEVVADAGNGVEALKGFAETRPDVVVMDLAAPSMDCPVEIFRMKELHPYCQVIALASEADQNMERRALAAGACCCILKDSSTTALVGAIHAARAWVEALGMTFVQAKTGLSTEWKSGAPSDDIHSVTEYDGTATETKALRLTR